MVFRQIMSTIKKIGTHDGVFHCDEVLACFMLKQLPEYKDAEIIRSRKDEILAECDIVVDVGGVYNPDKHRYDHHQRDFIHTMNSLKSSQPWTIKLSSAGLVYYHFGERIIEAVLGSTQDKDTLSTIFNYVYEHFIREIDGIDNGVPMYDGEPKYQISTGLSSRVSCFNPTWNKQDEFDVTEAFNKAMDLAGGEFIDRIHYVAASWIPARDIVKEALSKRFEIHQSGEIIYLPTICPWKVHLADLEKEQNLSPLIKYAIFTDTNGQWRVQAVPIEPNSFVCRVFLADDWLGLRNDDLSQVSGIEGCIFVHSVGFIGGNKTKTGAIQMAARSLELFKEKQSKTN